MSLYARLGAPPCYPPRHTLAIASARAAARSFIFLSSSFLQDIHIYVYYLVPVPVRGPLAHHFHIVASFSVSCILVRLCNPLSPRSTNPLSPRSPVRPSRPAARRPVPCNSYFFIIFVALFDLLFSFSFSYFLFLFCVPPTHRATFPAITRPQIAPVSPPLSLPTSLPSSLVGFVFVVVSYYCRRRRGYRRQSSCCPVHIHTRVNSRSFAIALAILPFVRIARPFCYIYMFWSSIVTPGPSRLVLPCPVPPIPIPYPILSYPPRLSYTISPRPRAVLILVLA